jgi:hypothetical protein
MIITKLIDKCYQPLVEDVEGYFSRSEAVLQEDRNTIKCIDFNKEKLVIKSYSIPNALNQFIYTYWRKPKASRAYEFGLKIAKFTPKVVAKIEHYQPKITKSFLICEYFEADFNLQMPLFRNHKDRVNMLKKFAEFVFELHENDILHQDLSPGNVLIKIKNDDTYEFKIIDINRMIFKTPTTKERAKNFNKLWADDADLALILSAYADLAGFDGNFTELGLKYNNQNKAIKTRKRNLKELLKLW